MKKIRVVDSHTEGEPTRVVIEGGPDLGSGSAAERLQVFRRDFDGFRRAVVNEPRGSDAMVAALLCPPQSQEAVAQVIFFNNVGYLGMCVHGSIGVCATLAWLGRIGPGIWPIETPVGKVSLELAEDGKISVQNVPSYRFASCVEVATQKHGRVRGDIAWGGNWFFLIGEHGLTLDSAELETLTEYCRDVRQSLELAGIKGKGGAVIDHIEIFAAPGRADADAKNFVLCPGGAYDRSPCGTGMSAKMACLAADGKLDDGQVWRQESIIGSRFTGTVTRLADAMVLPRVTGQAWITAETELIFQGDDPFRCGIRR